jgi:hypothetical protein
MEIEKYKKNGIAQLKARLQAFKDWNSTISMHTECPFMQVGDVYVNIKWI